MESVLSHRTQSIDAHIVEARVLPYCVRVCARACTLCARACGRRKLRKEADSKTQRRGADSLRELSGGSRKQGGVRKRVHSPRVVALAPCRQVEEGSALAPLCRFHSSKEEESALAPWVAGRRGAHSPRVASGGRERTRPVGRLHSWRRLESSGAPHGHMESSDVPIDTSNGPIGEWGPVVCP